MSDTSTPVTAPRDAAVATAISVIGAVCGTVLAAAFDGSASQRLTGAIIGAVVSTLFSVTGPYLHVRAAVGAAVTGVALLLTYGGAAVADDLTGNVTFPRVGPASAQTSDRPEPSADPSAPGAGTPQETCEQDLCLLLPREQQLCADPGCLASIVVANTGSRLLRIRNLEIEGPSAAAFRYGGGCANRPVKAGRSCTIVVTVVATPAGPATLVIHHNLRGPASQVTLMPTRAVDSRPDLRMSTKVRCSSSEFPDRFVIRTAVRNDGPGGFEGSVPVRVTEADGPTREFVTTVSDVVLSMPAGGTRDYTITVDPDDKVDEADESDNVRRIKADTGPGPDRTGDVPCSVG